MAQAQDPVCGAIVESAKAKARMEQFQNASYYFCSEACRRKFARSPEEYVPPSA